MTFLLYIGKNKDFLRKFSKLENVAHPINLGD